MEAALATAFFLALAVLNSYPLAFELGSAIGAHGDSYFSVWRLAWVAHQVVADPVHLFDANIFYPQPNTLAYSDAMLLPALVVAPLHWLGISPVAVYNLTLLAAFVLSGLAAYYLVRHLTGSGPAALLGGVIFAFSPHRMEHFDHLELQFAFWIPLAVLAWHRAIAHDTGRSYLRVAAMVSGQVLSSIYLSIFLITWLGFVTLVWSARTPRRALRAGALMLVPPLVVLAIYSVPYLQTREQLGDRRPREIALYSATASDFLSAPRTNVLYGWTDALGANERHLFPGLMVVGLVLVGAWPPIGPVRLIHAAGLGLAILLTIGLNGFLYGFLYDWVLPFRGLRVPARAAILILLAASVFAGFGLTRLLAWVTSRRLAALAATAVICLAMVEFLTSPRLVTVDRQVSTWYSFLRTVPGAVVFEWPVTVPWRLYNMQDVIYMYRSTMHWQPLLNGYSGHYPKPYIDLLLRMRSFPDTGSIAYLQRLGATILIVHEVPGTRPSFEYAVERLVRDPKVRVIAQDRDAGLRVFFFELLPEPGTADAR